LFWSGENLVQPGKQSSLTKDGDGDDSDNGLPTVVEVGGGDETKVKDVKDHHSSSADYKLPTADSDSEDSDKTILYKELRNLKIKRNKERMAALGFLSPLQGKVQKSRTTRPTISKTIKNTTKRSLPNRKAKSTVVAKVVDSDDDYSDGDSVWEEEEEDKQDSESNDEESRSMITKMTRRVRRVRRVMWISKKSRKSRSLKKKGKEGCTGTSEKKEALKKSLNNRHMNPNHEGFVAISKVANNPKQGIDPNHVKTILGAALTILDEDELDWKVHWFKDLKEVAGDIARLWIIQELLKNANVLGYGWSVSENIQDAWQEATTDHERKVVARKVNKCLSEGYFAEQESSLKKYVLEAKLMTTLKLVYVSEKTFENTDGCLARQASRSKADVLRQIGKAGKSIHSYILTQKAPKANTEEEGNKCKKERKDRKSKIIAEDPHLLYVKAEYKDRTRKIANTRKDPVCCVLCAMLNLPVSNM
jgi:hypothetical protein